jgi:hypothetical protein
LLFAAAADLQVDFSEPLKTNQGRLQKILGATRRDRPLLISSSVSRNIKSGTQVLIRP